MNSIELVQSGFASDLLFGLCSEPRRCNFIATPGRTLLTQPQSERQGPACAADAGMVGKQTMELHELCLKRALVEHIGFIQLFVESANVVDPADSQEAACRQIK